MSSALSFFAASSSTAPAERDRLLGPDELEAALRDIGARRYHNLHPFHRMLHGGRLNRDQVRAWALNRYYYPHGGSVAAPDLAPTHRRS